MLKLPFASVVTAAPSGSPVGLPPTEVKSWTVTFGSVTPIRCGSVFLVTFRPSDESSAGEHPRVGIGRRAGAR